MEARRGYRVQVAVAIAALAVAGVQPAAADDHDEGPIYFPPTTTVETNPEGVVVESEVHGTDPGFGGAGNQASGSGPRCYLREVPMSDWDEDIQLQYWYYRMRRAPYYVICGSEQRGIVWIEIDLSEPGSGSERIDPEDIAMRLRDEMPIPSVTVDVNPERGLVGTESWFWIAGYDGSAIADSTDAFGDLIEVEARVTRYEWSFGDGATLVSETPGKAYPARSEVRHVYERSSLGLPDGYPVEATFVFAVRYRVDGGAWIELPGITRLARADYPVRESQAVIRR